MPRCAHGEMTSSGTRGPRPRKSACGGATWSKKPPKSSHVSTIAVDLHSGERMIAFTIETVQFSPLQSDGPPGWSDSLKGGSIHVTGARNPWETSCVNHSIGKTCLSQEDVLRM